MYVAGSSEKAISWECNTATDSQDGLPCVIHSCDFWTVLASILLFCLFCFHMCKFAVLGKWHVFQVLQVIFLDCCFSSPVSLDSYKSSGALTSIPVSTGTLVFNFPLNEMSANDTPCFAGAMLWFNRAEYGLYHPSLVGAFLFWHCFLLTCCAGNNGDL